MHTRVSTKDSDKHPGWPVMVELDGKMNEVEDIIDRWISANTDPTEYPSEFWKIKALGKKYILMYNTLFDSWWLKECEK